MIDMTAVLSLSEEERNQIMDAEQEASSSSYSEAEWEASLQGYAAEMATPKKRRQRNDKPQKDSAKKVIDETITPQEAVEEPIEEINLGTMLDLTKEFLERYIVFQSANQSVALALWVAHTYAINAFDVIPYIRITAPTKEAGKSRLLEVLELLARDSWLVGSATPAAMVRVMAERHPTVLLDETDAAFAGNKERAETLRGVLNNGYARGKSHYMCNGPENEVKPFDVFGAKAFAGIGGLPDTIESRSITIELERKSAEQEVTRFRRRSAQKSARKITWNLARWATHENVRGIRTRIESDAVKPPDELSDRQQDVWEPLLAISEVAGEEWNKAALLAAKELSARGIVEDGDKLTRLLADIHAIFEEHKASVMSSKDIAQSLAAREESPWGPDHSGDAFNPRRLAAILKRIKITPKSVRIGARTPKGYEREQFRSAWRTYLPPKNNDVADVADHLSATLQIEVPEKPLFDGIVADVATLQDTDSDVDEEVLADDAA